MSTDDHLQASASDEYQDGLSAGSLSHARRCWHDLTAAHSLLIPQQFTFAFQCLSERSALGLIAFLRYTEYTGYVRLMGGNHIHPNRKWQVLGTTRARTWSLQSLEHLFMRLRGAGSRYVAALESLDLVPRVRG